MRKMVQTREIHPRPLHFAKEMTMILAIYAFLNDVLIYIL